MQGVPYILQYYLTYKMRMRNNYQRPAAIYRTTKMIMRETKRHLNQGAIKILAEAIQVVC